MRQKRGAIRSTTSSSPRAQSTTSSIAAMVTFSMAAQITTLIPAVVLRQIRSNVELWSADPSDDGPLLRGGMLAQARDWLPRRRRDPSPAGVGYVEAGL